jgi:pilus assembly protein CpaD
MFSLQVPIGKRRGSQAAHLLAMLAGATMLAGCVTTNPDNNVVVGAIPTDYRQRHPTVIKEEPRTIELFIGSKRGTLTSAQRADVFAFAHEWRREASGGVLIDLPAGTANERAAAGAMQEVRAILAGAGVPAGGIAVRPYHTRDPLKLATLRISYPRIAAEAGPCGLWPQDLGTADGLSHFENREYWNLGCASQHNLAAMVENPHDLVQPRGETPPYTGRRTTVLDKYHRGESTAAINPDAGKGKISSVGQ